MRHWRSDLLPFLPGLLVGEGALTALVGESFESHWLLGVLPWEWGWFEALGVKEGRERAEDWVGVGKRPERAGRGL